MSGKDARQRTLTMKKIDRETWDRLWPSARCTNLLQSWEYGDAKTTGNNWQAARYVVEDEFGNPKAVAQVLFLALPVIGGIARINRGPILLDGVLDDFQSVEVELQVFDLILYEARLRKWWCLFVAPELKAEDSWRWRLRSMGFRFRNKAPWASSRLSLVPSEDALLANLNGKWRNLLRKAQKSNLLVRKSKNDTPELEMLVKRYFEMQQEKKFSGVSELLLRQLCKQQGPHWRFDYYLTYDPSSSSEEYVGVLVSIIHGNSATYFIGSTNATGRKLNANYMMLWQAILDAKAYGCRWFDLGGLNEHTPPGVAHFKRGLNGDSYTLVGESVFF